MAFDPDAYYLAKSGGFDPDAYLGQSQPAPLRDHGELTLGERVMSGLDQLTGGRLGAGLDAVAPIARGFVQGAADPVVGTAQLAANLVGQGDAVNRSIADNEARQEMLGTSGLARFAGNVASPVNLAIAARLPQTIGLVRGGAALGAAGGAMQPVVGGDNYAAQKIAQASLGAATGGIGGAVLGGAAGLLAPRASEAARRLAAEGVELTPGQAAGGLLQRAEDKLMSAPFIGGAIAAARQSGIESFNKAALNRALAPLGKAVNQVGREGFKEVKQTIGKAYDDLLPQLGVRADQQFIDDLTNLRALAQNLPEAQARQFDNLLDNLALSRFTNAGTMSGETMKRVESELGRKASNYMRDASADVRDLGSALQEAQNTLRQLVMRSNPSKADELRKINEAYANYARLRRASSGVGAEEGVFTPAQLLSAIRAEDKTVGKAGFAQGQALMQDLAEAGKTAMGAKVPNSGTAERLMANVANPLAWPGLAGGAVAGLPAALLYSGPVRRAITQGIVGPRSAAQIRLADLIRRGGPAALIGAAGSAGGAVQ